MKKFRPYILPLICGSYVTVLIFLELFGYFTKIPKDAERFYYKRLKITGKVISEPKIKWRKINFILKDERGYKFSCWCRKAPQIERGYHLTVSGYVVPISKKERKNPYILYLLRKKIYFNLYASQIELIKRKPQPLFKLAKTIKQFLANKIRENVEPNESTIILNMFIGDRELMRREIKEIFQDAGVMHILVVSGLHVGFIISIFYFLFKLLAVSRTIRLFLLIPLIIIYALVTGMRPPVVRASLIAVITIICFILGREKSVLHALALSALIILLFEPTSLFNPSFQFSFLAYSGIVFLYPKFNKIVNISPPPPIKKIATLLFISLAAQLSVGPMIAYYFNKVSFISPIANLFVVPIGGMIISLSFLLSFSSLISSFLSSIIGDVITLLVDVFLWLVKFFADLPFSFTRVATPPLPFLLFFYLLLVLIWNFKKNKYIIAAATVLFISPRIFNLFQNITKINFIDVGLGDSILITTPHKKRILIDVGGSCIRDVGRRVIAPFLWREGSSTIDILFITQPHLSRYKGAEYLLKNFRIKALYISPTPSTEESYNRLLRNFSSKGVEPQACFEGKVIEIDGIKLKILNPSVVSGNPDKDCLVILLEYRDFKCLFTSNFTDLKKFKGKISRLDILQYPSHGKKPLDWNFNAKYIIISTNKMAKLEENFYSTSSHGNIEVILDSKGIKIR